MLMRPPQKIALIGLALLVGSPLGARSGSTEAQAKARAPRVTCAFSNPRYSGWCRVTEDVPEGTKPESVCQDVLSCLNEVSCTKTYCNATEVRGGWRLETVEAP
jgi:hypothetical protein